MSTFKPTEFDTEINVTNKHPLKEVSWLIGTIIAMIVGAYLVFSVLIVLLVPYVSIEAENKIWTALHFSSLIEDTENNKEYDKKQKYLQELLDSFPDDIKPAGYDFKIHIIDEGEQMNAFALPGGHIAITTELLDNIHSENVLSYIIGHELGHFEHRHHLKSLGLFAGTTLISITLLGSPDAASSFISGFISMASLANSRSDEIDSDEWAVKTLYKHYGHVGGANDFFKIIGDVDYLEIPEILSTHPLDEKRIVNMSKIIKDQNYKDGKLKPLPWKNKDKKAIDKDE